MTERWNNSWVSRNGTEIKVKDMELSHVENTLRMLIRKYNIFCISHGSRYSCNISLNSMTDDEKRDMLDQTCADRTYLKRLVANSCFAPTGDFDVYSEVMSCLLYTSPSPRD